MRPNASGDPERLDTALYSWRISWFDMQVVELPEVATICKANPLEIKDRLCVTFVFGCSLGAQLFICFGALPCFELSQVYSHSTPVYAARLL